MRFAKLFLRGLKDVYDQFVFLMIVSVMWWLCILLIVPGPPATAALFRMADPRNQTELPEFRDFFAAVRETFRTSWAVAGILVPVILILVWNTTFFQGAESAFAVMVPLWVVMFVIAVVLLLYAFATIAAMESGMRNAFRGATYLLVMRPFTSALLLVFLLLLMLLLAVLVLPLFLFGPAVVASVVNRFVLDGYGIPVIDPNSPTDERASERARCVPDDEGVRGFFGRMRGEKGARR